MLGGPLLGRSKGLDRPMSEETSLYCNFPPWTPPTGGEGGREGERERESARVCLHVSVWLFCSFDRSCSMAGCFLLQTHTSRARTLVQREVHFQWDIICENTFRHRAKLILLGSGRPAWLLDVHREGLTIGDVACRNRKSPKVFTEVNGYWSHKCCSVLILRDVKDSRHYLPNHCLRLLQFRPNLRLFQFVKQVCFTSLRESFCNSLASGQAHLLSDVEGPPRFATLPYVAESAHIGNKFMHGKPCSSRHQQSPSYNMLTMFKMVVGFGDSFFISSVGNFSNSGTRGCTVNPLVAHVVKTACPREIIFSKGAFSTKW